jgi:Family of unknown function (DUF5871)
MEYGKPTKLQDGSYFLRVSGQNTKKQINNVEVQEAGCFKVSDTLAEFDSKILEQADKCSEEWFGRKIENLQNAYDCSVSSGILDAPLAKNALVFNSNKEEVSSEVLVPGTKCDIIVELSGIWFIKKSFGPVWKVIQARLKKESTKMKYMFSDEDESE